MLVLRADPWTPEFGMGFAASPEEPPAATDATVETNDWTRAIVAVARHEGAVWFVDGVRRVELRLLADRDDRRAPGLFGSYAVGGVRSATPSGAGGAVAFGAHDVLRAVVLGGGLQSERLVVGTSSARLSFEPFSVGGQEPEAPLYGLQDLMRKAEGRLAASLADGEDGALVLTDGPLTFFDPTAAAVVGVVKRTSRRYLEADFERLLPELQPGERTPLFSLGDDERVRRYSWYTRLAPLRPPWHDHAGLVRCEVRASFGLEGAAYLADRVSLLLPRFAGRPADPRAPQNLAPVGALEAWLRHRMGHPHMIRRELTGWLMSEETVAS